jgi:hypothetical protein
MVKKSIPQPLSGPHESALIEIRRQLERGYALVHAARSMLLETQEGRSTPTDLLDMAEDVLTDQTWINRMDELLPRAAEVAHG